MMSEGLIWFGQLLSKCRRDDRAVEVFRQATQIAPDKLECWLELIRQQLRLGLSGPAEESLELAREKLAGADRDIVEAATFVNVLENRTGLKIACIEEIAYTQGWIDRAQLEANIAKLGKSSYGAYLRNFLAGR